MESRPTVEAVLFKAHNNFASVTNHTQVWKMSSCMIEPFHWTVPYCTEPQLLDILPLLPLRHYHTHVNRAEAYDYHLQAWYKVILRTPPMDI
eukprot:1058286-Ditylum_brightwellii.AAC.1